MVLVDNSGNDDNQTNVNEYGSHLDKSFKTYKNIAYRICIITIILDIILGLTAFVNCMLDKSSVGLSYSIDTLMDSICICFVAWHLKAQTMDDFKRRDYLVCCVIGALFIGSFLAIESRAIQSMIMSQVPAGDWLLLTYSIVHIGIFTVLSIAKIILSKQLKSKSLLADAFNSIIGIIMAILLILWDRIPILSRHTQIDDLISVVLALFLLVYGWILVHNGISFHNELYSESLQRENDDANVATALLSTAQLQDKANKSGPDDTHRQYMNLDSDVDEVS